MQYKGIELVEFKTTKDIVFNSPKRMLVWDSGCVKAVEAVEADVIAVFPYRTQLPVIAMTNTWDHCAEIPEEPKSKLATYRELAQWLARGNGEMRSDKKCSTCVSHWGYGLDNASEPVPTDYVVRKWEDGEWHEPTREYMGLEG